MAHEFKLMARIPRVRLLRGEMNREYVLSQRDEPVYLAACSAPLDSIALLLLDCGCETARRGFWNGRTCILIL